MPPPMTKSNESLPLEHTCPLRTEAFRPATSTEFSFFNFTNEVVPNFTNEVLSKNSKTNQDIDQFIFHQANAFMLNFMRKRLKIDADKFFIDLDNGGNTVSSTIPIALKKYSQTINTTENIILVGFGVGLSWSGGLIKISSKL